MTIESKGKNPDSCFLSPIGKIDSCGFGCHCELAHEIIERSEILKKEFLQYQEDHITNYDPVEFLMEECGYCKYMNWGDRIPAVWVTPSKRKPTRAQIHKMQIYSGYIYRG